MMFMMMYQLSMMLFSDDHDDTPMMFLTIMNTLELNPQEVNFVNFIFVQGFLEESAVFYPFYYQKKNVS